MATVHISSNTNEIAPNVIMPGDPLRAKYIADNFLENAVLINEVRNNLGYTGFYQGKRITVFASGMGFPSMGIYAYELFSEYNVQNIIRIGTAGSNSKDIKVGDLILANQVATVSNFAEVYDGTKDKVIKNSEILNNLILESAKNNNQKIHYGTLMSNEVFDPYAKDNKVAELSPIKEDYLGNEMEAFALAFLAKKFKKGATTIVTISDSKHDTKILTREEREKNLDKMIKIALDAITSLK